MVQENKYRHFNNIVCNDFVTQINKSNAMDKFQIALDKIKL